MQEDAPSSPSRSEAVHPPTWSMDALRGRVLNGTLIACAIGSVPLTVASLWRVRDLGWHNLMLVHILVSVSLNLLCLFRHRISFRARAFSVVLLSFVLGSGALLTWGVAGRAFEYMIFCCIFSSLFFGFRSGLFAILAALSAMILAFFGAHVGVIRFPFDFGAYLLSTATWTSGIMSFVVLSTIAVAAIVGLTGGLEGANRELDRRGRDLSRTNEELNREIEDRKKAEAVVLQANKMEAIGTLAGGIAHDFNNILQSITSNAELLLMDHGEHPTLRDGLDSIRRDSDRGAGMVKQILTFSRLTRPEMRPADIRVVLLEGVKFMRSSLPSTIEIRNRSLAESGMIMGDPTQIYQVLINLCTNAAQALPDQRGWIEITLDEADPGSLSDEKRAGLKPGPCLRLSVRDNGCGIEEDVMARIFDPFFTTKEIGKGTGMGLSVVHGIVKAHGGAITVDSQPGNGSDFRVWLPRMEGQAPTAPQDNEAPPTGEGSILFVDDEESIAASQQKILQCLGYDVVAVTSSREALERFRERPHEFDLVITDMAMPLMDGVELFRELRRIRPDIPAILCTGFSERISSLTAGEIGFADMLMKPSRVSEIGAAVHKILARGNPGARPDTDDLLPM